MKQVSLCRILLLSLFLLSMFFLTAKQYVIYDYPEKNLIIDGYDNDWPPNINYEEINEVNVTKILLPLKGSSDFKGKFKAFYNSKKNLLYLYVIIYDDFLNPKVNDKQPGWLWDRLEIFIDGTNSKSNDIDYFQQYVISPLANKPVYVVRADKSEIAMNNEVKYDVKYMGNKISFEIAILVYANRSFNWLLKMDKGKIMGFDIAYADNDGDNFGQVGSYISWNKGTAKHKSSKTYGELILGGIYTGKPYTLTGLKKESILEKISITKVIKKPVLRKQRVWLKDLTKALNRASKENKDIFVYFFMNISRCKDFEKTVLKKYEDKIFENYVPLKLNVHEYMNYAVNKKVYRVPSILIIDCNGNVINRIDCTRKDSLKVLFY